MRSVLLFVALIAVASAWRAQAWYNLPVNTTSCPSTTPTFDVLGSDGACFSSSNSDVVACLGAGGAGSSVKITTVVAAGGNGCLNNATCLKLDLYTSTDCSGTASGPAYQPLNTCTCNNCPALPTTKVVCSTWASASTIASGVAVIALLVAALL